MLLKAYKRCYDVCEGRTEYMVKCFVCPLERDFCFGGFVWIGDTKPEYSIEAECEYYDKDSFKEYDGKIECNLEVKNDK